MIEFESKGSFRDTEAFLKRMSKSDIYRNLENYAQMGVDALSRATPVESSETAHSWSYEITSRRGTYNIAWKNSHMAEGVPVVILLQYGHATGTGGYVQGRDFINPAIQPIFDKIANEVWKAVTK